MITVRELREGDAAALLADLRPQDAAECDALVGPGQVAAALRQSIEASAMVWTAEVPAGLLAVFGVSPVDMLGGFGIPWLVGTPQVDANRRAFIRLARPYIARMLAVFPHLANVVDARNVKSIAFLRRMGFSLHPPAPCGAAGLPFHPFTLDA